MFSTLQPTDKRVDRRARFEKAMFVLIFGALGPLAFMAPKGLWILILLLLLVKLKTITSVTPRVYRRILGQNTLYLILPIYGVLSAAWAIVPEDAAITSAKIFGYFVAALAVVIVVDRLSVGERRLVVKWLAVGLVIADLLIWLDLGTVGALSGLFKSAPFTANLYSRGAAVSAFVILPVAVGLFRLAGLRSALVFAGTCVATIFALENEAAKLAVVIGTLVYLAVRWCPVLFWPIIVLPLALGIISPMIFSNEFSNSQLCTIYNGKPSMAHRLIIYEFSSKNILKKPFFGWGMDASRSIPGGGGKAEILNCEYKKTRAATLVISGLVPLHPHNASLQVWLELGVVGVAIFVGLLGTLLVRLQRGYAFGNGRPLIAGLFAVIFLVYNISFGLWQGWLIFTLIMVCAIVRSLRLDGRETNNKPSR